MRRVTAAAATTAAAASAAGRRAAVAVASPASVARSPVATAAAAAGARAAVVASAAPAPVSSSEQGWTLARAAAHCEGVVASSGDAAGARHLGALRTAIGAQQKGGGGGGGSPAGGLSSLFSFGAAKSSSSSAAAVSSSAAAGAPSLELAPLACAAVRALHAELAGVRELARSRERAALRFAWWRDVVDGALAFGGSCRSSRSRSGGGGGSAAVLPGAAAETRPHGSAACGDSHGEGGPRALAADVRAVAVPVDVAAADAAAAAAAGDRLEEEGESPSSEPASFVEAALASEWVLPHGVSLGLAAAAADQPLTKTWFRRLLNARAREDDQFATMTEMERYAEDTASSLLYLLLECCGVRDLDAEHAASHVGKAVGMATLLRATAHHAAHRRCFLPADVLAEHRLTPPELYRAADAAASGGASAELPDSLLASTHAVASVALGHLEHARDLQDLVLKKGGHVAPLTAAVLLPFADAEDYLLRLEDSNFNPLDPSLLRPSARYHVRYTARALRGRYA